MMSPLSSLFQIKLLFSFTVCITVSRSRSSLYILTELFLGFSTFHIRKCCILMTRRSELQPSKITFTEKCTKWAGGPAASLGKVLIALISSHLTHADVTQWLECRPGNRKVTGLVPGQGTFLGCGPGDQLGSMREATNQYFSHPSLSFPPFSL